MILRLSRFENVPIAFAFLVLLVLGGAPLDTAEARPGASRGPTPDGALDRLQARVQAVSVPIVDPCREAAAGCEARSLDRFRSRLRELKSDPDASVRVLQLGDSQIAADLISGFVRDRLQKRFGNAGRGLVHADQGWGYGGRAVGKEATGWNRTRVVDRDGPGRRFGLFGLALSSARGGARRVYRVLPEDQSVVVHFEAGPGRAGFEAMLDRKSIEKVSVEGDGPRTQTFTVDLGGPRRTGASRLALVAAGRGTRLYGLGLYSGRGGVVWSAIGPVGADAQVYLQTEQQSFREGLRAHDPHLVVLMVGGNDALKVRKGWRSLADVEEDHRELVANLRRALPNCDILLMSPMDAGQRKGSRVLSKPRIEEVRDIQARLSQELGIAFWDTHAAMGGSGAIARWVRAGVMSDDLVHPRRSAADLLGRLLSEAILDWFDSKPSADDR